MKKIISLLCLLLAMTLPLTALAATKVISPSEDFYVTDQANVLSEETEGLIVLNNDKLEEACGAQIVFVTVDTVGSSTMENYAYTLFNEWGIGSKKENNGVLVLLAIEDDDYWLLQGKGLQDDLTAGDLGEYAYEYLEPYFAKKDYDQGVRALFSVLFEQVNKIERAGVSLDAALYDEYIGSQTFVTEQEEEEEGIGLLGIIGWIILLYIVFKVVRSISRGGRSASRPVTRATTNTVRNVIRPIIHISTRPGGMNMHRPSGGGFSSGRSSGSSRSSFSGSRSSGRSGGFGGGRSGGGGGSRGGGAGRGR